ncbi:hypothetical protein GTQ43_07465 [Nostoc sp. KVJ3]|nr:hypothetical protein [Nostoc sp. KVJ3]
MEKRQGWQPKRSKSLSAIGILLFWATPLLITSTAVASIAPTQRIAQVNPQDSINRPTLKVGSQGDRVSELQAALKLLGFYSGAVDGIYSENTASAVSRFKQAAGLNPDGIVDASTWQRLFPNQPVAASTVPSSQPIFNSATNFPIPTQANNLTNVANPSPPKQAVTQVATNPQPRPTTSKKAVTQVATSPQPRPTTSKKAVTQVATQVTSSPEPRPATPRKGTNSRTQKRPNRTTSTTQTQSNTTTKRTSGIQYTSEGLPILRIGLRGSEVVKLQEQLKKLGFLKGDADGDFGVTTETAVKAAQKRYGIEPDGVVGGSTWEVLLRR